MKVTVGKINKAAGAWINDTPSSDVHIMVQPGFVVIGENKDYNADAVFSSPALVITDKGECYLQIFKDGEVVQKAIAVETVDHALREFLSRLENHTSLKGA